MFRVAAVALGGLLGLAAVELALRVAWRTPVTYRALVPGLEARFDPQHRTGGPALFRVNSMGVRAREWDGDRRGEYRILCVGGSTTENVRIDQSRVWTTRLEEMLGTWPDGRRVWVGNIGRSGLGSRHHLIQMQHLLDVYEPDRVVILLGINDLSGALRRGVTGDAFPVESDEQAADRALAVRPGRLPGEFSTDPWFKRTRLWLLARSGKDVAQRYAEFQDRKGQNLLRWRDSRARGRRSATLPPLEKALLEYRRNLERIVDIAQHRSLPLVFMTQPSLYRAGLSDADKSLLWAGGVGDFRRVPNSLYYEPEALAEGMEAFNDTLLQVCRERQIKCVDLAGAIPKTREFFYDDFHFTDGAQDLVASTLARALAPSRPSTAISQEPRKAAAAPEEDGERTGNDNRHGRPAQSRR